MYIKGIGAVSIQEPFQEDAIFDPQGYNTPQVRCVEPDFARFIAPMAARRMSKIIKRSIVASLRAVGESGIEMPDAILSSTGLGCVEDTEKFLDAMCRNGEHCLQPSFFIQSTHNTIGSQIAIRLNCHGYNNTHVHRGVSFESALQEAVLLFRNGRVHSALVGGYDELTPAYFCILKRLGYWREDVPDTLRILEVPLQSGTFAGEGSICFMLSDKAGPTDYAKIEGTEIHYGSTSIQKKAMQFLTRCGVSPEEIDLILTGRNGDLANDAFYEKTSLFPSIPEMIYKPLCGEFFTAPAFGLYVAAVCIKRGIVPSHLCRDGQLRNGVKRILLFNHWQGKEYSFTLLTSCGS